MLFIAMHNNYLYLQHLKTLAEAQGVQDARIVEKEKLGFDLVGRKAGITLSQGGLSPAYDKAFMVTCKSEAQAQQFLTTVEQEVLLGVINLDDKGFVCLIPVHGDHISHATDMASAHY